MKTTKRFVCSIANVLKTGAMLGALAISTACGGGTSSNPSGTPAGSTMMQFRIGDAPADRVVAFEISIANPIVLHPAGGGTAVNINLGQNRLELSHMSGTSEPLTVQNVPQGSYASMDLTINHPEVTFLDSAGQSHQIESNTAATITVNLNPALTVGATPSVISLDVNVANSLSFDAQGNVTAFNFTSASFGVTNNPVSGDDQQKDDDGALEHITGTVASVSGTSFTLSLGPSGTQLTFTTDSNTHFEEDATLASLLNMIVRVEGVTKADGTLYAKEVEGLEHEEGAELEGLVMQVTGNPATSLSIVAQDGVGHGMDDTKVGAPFTVDVSAVQASKYRIDQGNLDFSGLNVGGPQFPFGPTTIHAGQSVEVEAADGVPPVNGTLVAENVKLQQQRISGTVTAISDSAAPRTITIAVPADSAFSILAGGGTPTITVFDQPGTDDRVSVTVGTTVRVRGLLFFTGSQFNLVARRIDQ
jgi:hypothetical protein